ncbi:MAG: 2-amino-4-hydroxy-6-hydroxymethyldihydropteridine diphosphokinase [Chloroflexi bacterium]|nr:2-amino-4-hydroxy-6-hydroxymethyldihydropteridine diphosphokinase [Chloroflexota bacterium]
MATVYLGMGSNLGDREKNLNLALEKLGRVGKVTEVSSLYETEPVGYQDQPWFLNMVCELQTELSPHELLQSLKAIEKNMGRTPGPRFGPRPIDLDILLYKDLVLNTPELIIPHPRLAERAFVLIPLAEIAPQVLHPVLKKTIQELRDSLSPGSEVRPFPGSGASS